MLRVGDALLRVGDALFRVGDALWHMGLFVHLLHCRFPCSDGKAQSQSPCCDRPPIQMPVLRKPAASKKAPKAWEEALEHFIAFYKARVQPSRTLQAL